MNTLILGGSTFVGRRLVETLNANEHQVTVLNRGVTTSNLPVGVSRILGDRSSTESMRSALGRTEWDSVIDVSGFVMAAGGGQFEDLIGILDGQIGSYVYVSSIMAYEPTGLMPWTEDQPASTDPRTTYGGYKAYSERILVERFADTGFPAAIARPAAIYGPHNNIHDMETAMFLRLTKGLPILLPHEGLVATSYGHVDDLCTNLVELATLSTAWGEIVNVTGQGCTSRQYVDELSAIVGVVPQVVEIPAECTSKAPIYGHLFKDRHHGILSVAKAHGLGLTRERGFRIGHEQAYEWFCASALVDAPARLSDPTWGAGYDFELEAQVVEQVRAS